MRASLFVVTAALVAGAAVATPFAVQQQLPVFRAEANYVEVTARVVDKDGKFIDGLTARDFSLTEDHRQQTVEHVFRVDLPTPWNKTTAVKPVMYRPGLPNEMQVAEGRIYLLYLNSVPSNRVVETRTAAHEFVNNYLQPEDIMAVWSTFSGVTFTNDKARLNKKIEEFLGTHRFVQPGATDGRPGRRLSMRIHLGTRLVQRRAGAQEVGPVVLGRVGRHRAGVFEPPDSGSVHHTAARSLGCADLRVGYAWSHFTARTGRAGRRQRGVCGCHGDVECPGLLHWSEQYEVAG